VSCSRHQAEDHVGRTVAACPRERSEEREENQNWNSVSLENRVTGESTRVDNPPVAVAVPDTCESQSGACRPGVRPRERQRHGDITHPTSTSFQGDLEEMDRIVVELGLLLKARWVKRPER